VPILEPQLGRQKPSSPYEKPAERNFVAGSQWVPVN